MAAPVLQFKRGQHANVGVASFKAGEPGFTTDKYDFYIGLDGTHTNQKFLGSSRYWLREAASTGSAVRVVEGSGNGDNYIELKSPASLAGNLTYTLPGTQGAANSIIENDGSGNLTFTNTPTFTGATVTGDLAVGGGTTITGDLYVGGTSEFIGVVTFRGGTVRLGDGDTDNIVVGGEFASHLVPDQDGSFDLGTTTKEWRNLFLDGTAEVDGINNSGVTTTTALKGYSYLQAPHSASTQNYTVTVAAKTAAHRYNGSGSSNGYVIDGVESPTLTLTPGKTYRFTLSSSDMTSHPFRFYLDADKTYAYTTNVTTAATYAEITVTDTTPAILHYQCSAHSLMGNTLVCNTNAVHTPHSATFEGSVNAKGDVTLGDAVSDLIFVNGQFDSDLLPSTDGTYDLGSSTKEWQDLFIDGTANIDTLSADSAAIADLTDNRVVIAGTNGELEDSANLTFDGTTLAVTGNATVDNVRIDGNEIDTTSGGLTLDSNSGTVTVDDNLTVNGTFTVLGTQSIINTETLKVEDSLIEIGLVNSGGSLVAPTSDANIDVGVILHYYSGSAKKAAMYWDDSVSRLVFADETSENTSVLTASSYADVEFKGLFINDCAGQSQVISCTGTTRNLENITVDGGSF